MCQKDKALDILKDHGGAVYRKSALLFFFMLRRAHIVLRSLVILNIISVSATLFEVHFIVYGKVRAMPAPDAAILKKIRRVMFVSAVAGVLILALLLSQLVAGKK